MKLWKYKVCKLKAFFEKGYGLTTYFKYLFLLFGFYDIMKNESMKVAFIGGTLYAILCFVIGWAWYKYEWVLEEAEVGNQFNYFQRQIRKKFKIEKNKKRERFK